MNIDIIEGDKADRVLEDPKFLEAWRNLCASCPWSTTFQSPDFVAAWYRVYRPRFSPVLVLSRNTAGEVQALLTLALDSRNNHLAVAGTWHAEYHVWLCAPDLADTFPPAALAALRPRLPSAGLRFTYVPPNTPLDWTRNRAARRTCLLTSHRRPLMRLGDGRATAESLAKSSNKSRLKRLKKLGPVEFKRVTDPAELERLFDDLIPHYDGRRIAVNGSAPFRNDPLKRPFHLAMAAVPGLLHATVLTVGPHLAAAHLGVRTGDELQLGLIAHNPLLASHSPGKFQLLFLAQAMLAEGLQTLDLTAGGDPYKERFADAWDEVHTLAAFPSAVAAARGRVLHLADATVRKTLKRLKVSPARASILKRRLTRLRPGTALAAIASPARRAAAWACSTQRVHLYVHTASNGSADSGADAEYATPTDAGVADGTVHRDRVADLLAYDPAPGEPLAQEFVAAALARLEGGLHCYTCVVNGRLASAIWLAERPEPELLARHVPGIDVPPTAALAFDTYTSPAARGRGSETDCLRAALRDARRIPGVEQVLLAAPATHNAAVRAAEELGLVHQSTLVSATRVGRTRHRVVPAPTAPTDGRRSPSAARGLASQPLPLTPTCHTPL